MMNAACQQDQQFLAAVELGEFQLAEFSHRAHLRLAYLYLLDTGTTAAWNKMRSTLRNYLRINNVDPDKYHETITAVWIKAVRHFLQLTPCCSSADDFINQQPQLLDANIKLSHYSAERLFSEQARERFLAPDLCELPEYDA